MPRPSPRGYARKLVGVALALMLCVTQDAYPLDRDEGQIKAGFLYNFAKYTEWPTAASERLLCVAAKALPDAAIQGIDQLPLQNSTLRVRTIARPGDAVSCDILFIGRPQHADQHAWLDQVAGRPTLTIADLAGPGRPRAMIRLFTEGRRLRYDLHQGMARQVGMQFAPRLVNLADTLYTDPESP